MSLRHANGKIQWLNADPIATQYTINSLNFKPKAIRVYAVGIQSSVDAATSTQNANLIGGFCDSALNQRSVSAFERDNIAAPSECGCIARNDCIACTTNNTGAQGGILRVDSITDTGFVLEIDATTLSADVTILWDVWGGEDISVVTVGDFTAAASTGEVDYACTGMVPGNPNQILMLAGCHSTAAMNTGTNTDAGFWTGFAHASGGQCVACTNSDDASNPSVDPDSYVRSDECIAAITVGGGDTASRAKFVRWNTDQFRLNWTQAATSGQQNIFMAIKGGSWAAGGNEIVTTTGNVRTLSTGFRPVGGLLLAGLGGEQDSGLSIGTAIISQGSFSGTTSSQSAAYRSAPAVTPTEVVMAVEYDEALAKVRADETLDWAIDVDAIQDDAVRLIVTQNIGENPAWLGWVAFGNQQYKLLGQACM